MTGRQKKTTAPAPPSDRAAESPRKESSTPGGFPEDYLSVVAHDLRGSLNSIIGWAELIKRKALPEEGAVRAGETIIRQAKNQLELINEMVDTWRLLSGNLHLKLAAVDAKELISQAVHACEEAAAAKRIRIDMKLDSLPKPLFADAARIRQALVGLLTSAVHFASEDGTLRVSLAPADGRMAEIVVHAAGAAMDPEGLDHLFSRERGPRGTGKPARTRFGRGLALMRDIVDLHGGSVRAESDGGSGVTFRLRLPCAAPPRAVRDENADLQRDRAELRSRLAGTAVLIVDDDPDAREVVGAILRHYGAKVIVATSVSTALVALRREQVHVLIADLGMPVEDGFDLIRHVRGSDQPAIAAMPAAALTAYTSEEDRERVLEAGYQFHLAKPVDPAVLVATVERLRAGTASIH